MKTVIEEDLTLDGSIKSIEGIVEVKGKVTGNVTAASVVLYENGTIDGALTATSVSIEGNYKGTLKCDDLRVAATSNVKGDVSAKTMTTESRWHICWQSQHYRTKVSHRLPTNICK